jgi:L-iditol 2-dehydrogenase
MWAYRLVAPGRLDLVDTPTPQPGALALGSVLLKLTAGGICGSDLGPFRRGRVRRPLGAILFDTTPHVGFPMHEVVGEVISSNDPEIAAGAAVVGWASGYDGLAEYCVSDGDGLATYDPALAPMDAVLLQTLACVLYAAEQIPGIAGANVAVLGLGPIGLLFSHVVKTMGASTVTGVDLIGRWSVAEAFGLDTTFCMPADTWAALHRDQRPDLVIEAIGHQVSTMVDAIEAVDDGGTIYYFGIPDDSIYPFPFMQFLRKNLTLRSGITLEKRRYLAAANAYLRVHPELLAAYITHRYDIHGVQDAFAAAANSDPARVKVVLTIS